MPRNEDPVSVLRALIDAMNRGEHDAGLTSMTEDVVIIDDVRPSDGPVVTKRNDGLNACPSPAPV